MSYQDVKDKLYRGHKKIANNTNITLEGDWSGGESIVMRLHGYYVAAFYPTYIKLDSAGWHTRTTKDRLNLALELAGLTTSRYNYARIYQVDYQWYYGNHNKCGPKFYNGIKIDYTGKVLS